MDNISSVSSSLQGIENIEGFEAAFTGAFLVVYLVMLALCIVCLFAMAKVFKKAGVAGWKILIPVYNTYLTYKIVFGNGWLFLLQLIPLVGYVMPFVLEWKLAKVFGKGTGFAILSLFFSPITRMILGFGSSEYTGPVG